jgi:hypothetical protein
MNVRLRPIDLMPDKRLHPMQDNDEDDHDEGGFDLLELRKTLVKLRGLRKNASRADWLWTPVSEDGPLWIDHYQNYLVEALRSQIDPAIRRLGASKPLPQRLCKILDAMMVLNELADRRKLALGGEPVTVS